MTMLLMRAWQMDTIAAYQHRHAHEAQDLQTDMARRIERLTGCRVALHNIYVNRDERRATTVVDGVIFRLEGQRLAILRSCVVCGVTQFASAALADAADVGYALHAWQPHCRHCEPTDPAE